MKNYRIKIKRVTVGLICAIIALAIGMQFLVAANFSIPIQTHAAEVVGDWVTGSTENEAGPFVTVKAKSQTHPFSAIISVAESTTVEFVYVSYRTLNGIAIGGEDFTHVSADQYKINSGTSITINIPYTVHSAPALKLGTIPSGDDNWTKDGYLRDFYFEVFRIDGGKFEKDSKGNKINNRVKFYIQPTNGTSVELFTTKRVNYDTNTDVKTALARVDLFDTLPDVFSQAIKFDINADGIRSSSSSGEMGKGAVVKSLPIERSSLLASEKLKYYQGINAGLVFDIRGSLGRKSISGLNDNKGISMNVLGYTKPDLIAGSGRSVASRYVEHGKMSYASDADNASKKSNVLFNYADSYYNNSTSAMKNMSGNVVARIKAGKDADGKDIFKDYLKWDENADNKDNNYLVQEVSTTITSYWEKVWNQMLYATIYDAQAPKVIGYHTTNSSYKFGDTIEIAVVFDEIVNETTGKSRIRVEVAGSGLGTSSKERWFNYKKGAGSNVLVYSYTLGDDTKDVGIQINELKINALDGFDAISDLAYTSTDIPHNFIDRETYRLYGSSNFNTSMVSATGGKVKLNLIVDTQMPKVSVTSEADPKTSMRNATFNIALSEVSNGVALSYAFTNSPDRSSVVQYSNLEVSNKFTSSCLLAGVTGKYYLHLRVVSMNGNVTLWSSTTAYYMDNQEPKGVFSSATSGMQNKHVFMLEVSDTPFYEDDEDTELIDETKFNVGIDKIYLFFQLNPPGQTNDGGILIVDGGNLKTQYEFNDNYVVARKLGGSSDDQSYEIEANNAVKVNGMHIFKDGKYTSNLYARIYDKLGNQAVISLPSSFLLDTREGIVDFDFSLSSDNYASVAGGFAGFSNAYYHADDLSLSFTRPTNMSIYIENIELNGTLLARTGNDDEPKDYEFSPADGVFIKTEDKGDDGHGVTQFEISLKDFPAGYYKFIFKNFGVDAKGENTYDAEFYLSADKDSNSPSETVFTENITQINSQKLIESLYWETERDFIWRKYNKYDADKKEGNAKFADGVVEQVFFVAANKNLIYATYNAALNDMILRERKDVRLLTQGEKTPSFIETLNISNRNPEGKVFKATDNIYEYKPKNFTGDELYHYYSSSDSPAILEALTANAQKNVGANPENKTTNAFRRITTEGIGFDLAQIVDVSGYSIFDNTVLENGNYVVNASNTILKKDGDVRTEIHYSVQGQNKFYSIELERDSKLKLSDIIPSTGAYDIIEFSSRGGSRQTVHIDCSSPQLEVDFYKGATQSKSGKNFIDKSDNGLTFHLSRAVLKNLNDTDSNSVLVIYEDDGGFEKEIKAVYTAESLSYSSDIILSTNGNYIVEIYDRSGNNVVFYINIKTTAIIVEKTSLGASNEYEIKISNRTANEIYSSQLYFNDMLTEGFTYVNNRFATTIILTNSGSYFWRIVDVYGFVYEDAFEYAKIAPIGVFYEYNVETRSWVSLENTSLMYFDQSVGTYVIKSKNDLQFRYTNSKYSVALYNVQNYSTSTIDAVIGSSPKTYVVEIPATNSSWSIRLGYTNDIYVYTMFTCLVDTVPPQIFAKAEIGVVDGVKQYSDIMNQGAVNADSASIFWDDSESDVSRISVSFNGSEPKFFYDLTKYSNGYVITEEGSYTICAYDLLGNMAEFNITIDRSVAFSAKTQGQTVKADAGETIYTCEDVYFYIDEPLTFETGTVSFYINKSMVSFEENGIDGTDAADLNTCSYVIALTEAQLLDEDFKYSESFLYEFLNGQKVYYGIERNGAVYLKFTAPPALGNNDWSLNTTYDLELAIYDNPLGNCEVFAIDAEEQGKIVLKNGISLNLSEKNSLFMRFEISNQKSTTGFVSVATGQQLPDIKETIGFGKYNTDFRLNKAGLSDIVRIEVRSHLYNVELAEYVDITKAGFDMVFSLSGVYQFRFTNRYGVQFVQSLRLGKGLGADITAVYNDGSQRMLELFDLATNIAKKELYAQSNSKIAIEFDTADLNLTILRNGVDITSDILISISNITGYPSLMLEGDGEYIVTAKDELNNILIIYATILYKAEDETGIVIRNILTGFNSAALMADKNYTNNALAFTHIDESVYFLEYEYYSFDSYSSSGRLRNGTVTNLLLDKFAFETINNTINFELGKVNGQLVNGVYLLRAYDIYGNSTTLEIFINNVADIFFFKQMRDDADFNEVSHAEVKLNGLNSNYSLRIMTGGNYNYELKVDDELFNGNDPITITKLEKTLLLVNYVVTYIDDFGNKFSFRAKIDRQQPVLTLVNQEQFVIIDNTFVTKNDAALVCNKSDVYMVYTLNGGSSMLYEAGSKLTETGSYVFTVTDFAGNTAGIVFHIDKVVEYTVYSSQTAAELVVPQGIVINSGFISFNAVGSEKAVNVVAATRNGVEYPITEGQSFDQAGEYVVTLNDLIGNEAQFSFIIIKDALQSFTYRAPEGYTFFSVEVVNNGISSSARYLIDRDENQREVLTISENMLVNVIVSSIDTSKTSDRFSFSVTTDLIKPFLTMHNAVSGEKTRKDVSFSNISEKSTIFIFKDSVLVYEMEVEAGASVNFVVTDKGEYLVRLVDLAGNESEYTFTRIYTMNNVGIIMLIIFLLIIAAVIIIFLKLRKGIKVS